MSKTFFAESLYGFLLFHSAQCHSGLLLPLRIYLQLTQINTTHAIQRESLHSAQLTQFVGAFPRPWCEISLTKIIGKALECLMSRFPLLLQLALIIQQFHNNQLVAGKKIDNGHSLQIQLNPLFSVQCTLVSNNFGINVQFSQLSWWLSETFIWSIYWKLPSPQQLLRDDYLKLLWSGPYIETCLL